MSDQQTDGSTIAQEAADAAPAPQANSPDSAELEQTTQSDQSSNKPALPKDSPLLASFLKQLDQVFSAQELKKNWRVLPTGLFVDADLIQKLLKALAEFRARETKSAITIDDRLFILLFGSALPTQYYLLEGKLCLIGHFIRFHHLSELQLNIPVFRGSLIDCRDQLHPRDPWLSSLTGVESKLDNSGFVVKLRVADQLIVVSNAGLTDFHEVLCASPRLRNRYRAANRSLRDALVPLGKLLKSASLVGAKQTLFIPGRYRQDRKVQFYRLAGLVFVIQDNVLLSAYELRGKNLFKMIDSEILDLKARRTYRVAAIELSRKSGAIIGAINTPDGEQNLIHIQTILRMLELALRRRSLRRQLKARVTLFDLLKLLSNLLCETVRIEPREVPYAVLKSYLNLQARKEERRGPNKGRSKTTTTAAESKNSKEATAGPRRTNRKNNSSSPDADSLRYRSGAGWIFFIHDRRVIKSMLERRSQTSPTVKIIGKVPSVALE